MKKGVGKKFVIGLFLFVFLFSIVGFVSAATSDVTKSITDGINSFAEVASPIFSFLLGDVGGADPGLYLLLKFLFMIIILSLVYYAFTAIPGLGDNKFLAWIISIAVSIIAVRFMGTEEIVNFIWLPNGVLGVTFAALLPFLLFFFFIEKINVSTVRKVGWIAFLVIFVGLAIYRWDALAVTGNSNWYANLGWMYVIIIVLSVLAIIFDRQIRARFILSSLEIEASKHNLIYAQRYLDEIDQWENVRVEAMARGDKTAATAAEKKIKTLRDAISKL
ncbi:MAG: hypothetical protein Q7S56_01000 [Nanoarchaeota archaeon]|nr:hypothetical protein [Nanoarchaeota archaeon]